MSNKIKNKYLITVDGKRRKVVSEDGKFFYCAFTRFRKLSPLIKKVEEKDEIIKGDEKKESLAQD